LTQTNLTIIKLSNIDLPGPWLRLSTALEICPNITEFTATYCNITDSSCIGLSKWIIFAKNLRNLCLSNNNIDAQGLKWLLSGIIFSGIINLDLHGNNYSSLSLYLLSVTLVLNMRIKTLKFIDKNCIGTGRDTSLLLHGLSNNYSLTNFTGICDANITDLLIRNKNINSGKGTTVFTLFEYAMATIQSNIFMYSRKHLEDVLPLSIDYKFLYIKAILDIYYPSEEERVSLLNKINNTPQLKDLEQIPTHIVAYKLRSLTQHSTINNIIPAL